MTQHLDIFGLGQCSLDYIGEISMYPKADEKCEFSNMVIQGGGPVATALTALSRWGLNCAFSGVIGNDLFGSMIRASLDEEGIDTGGMIIRKNFDSQFAFIACEPESGGRTIFWRRPTGSPLEPEEVNLHMITGSRIVHTDGLFMKAALHACRFAKDRGIPVSVDAGTLREGMLDLARLSDFFIVSESFASALVGGDDPLEACRKIAELGPRVAGVTLGKRGCVAIFDGVSIRKPAYPVKALDTTGCGDIFHAGFIYGIMHRWSIEKTLDFAAWTAAMVSRSMGGRTGIPSMTEVKTWNPKEL